MTLHHLSDSLCARGDRLLHPPPYSDASIAIVIGHRWCAWRLIPVGVLSTASMTLSKLRQSNLSYLSWGIVRESSQPRYILYGDNVGVFNAWSSGRSRNPVINAPFRCIHAFLEPSKFADYIHSTCVCSANNPTDAPSRGSYLHESLLLPPLISQATYSFSSQTSVFPLHEPTTHPHFPRTPTTSFLMMGPSMISSSSWCFSLSYPHSAPSSSSLYSMSLPTFSDFRPSDASPDLLC